MENNQIKSGAILSYVNTAIKLIIHFTYTPVMIRLLGQGDYGLYTLVGSVVSYLNLFGLGFSGAYLRFYSRYKAVGDDDGEASLNGLFLLVFSIMASMAMICGFILSRFPKEVFGSKLTSNELEKSQILMIILAVNIGFSFFISVFSSIVCAHEQFAFQRLLELVSVVLNPIVCLPFLMAGYGSVVLVVVATVISIASLIVYIFFCNKRLHVHFHFSHLDFVLLKEIFVFSSFLFLNMIIDQINWHIDKFILGRVSGTDDVAIYGVGGQFNSVFLTLTVAISAVFAPRVNMIEAENGRDKNELLSKMFVKTGRLQYAIILYAFTVFAMVGRPFITWWIGKEYEQSYYVALLLVAPLVVILPHSLGIEIRQAKNKHKMASVFMLFTALLNLFISIPLAMAFGAVGSAIGTCICLVVNMIIMDLYYMKIVMIDVGELYRNMLTMTVPLIPLLVFIICGIRENVLSKSVVFCALFSLVYGVVIYCFSFNSYERQIVKSVLGKIQNLIKNGR